MEDNDRGIGSEELTAEERELFARRLIPPEAPPLPASLTAEALFRRLDEGTLTLPEEEPSAETLPEPAETGKVIPWQKALRRWLPVAACLVVVLLLYQNRQSAMAKNFLSGAPAPAAVQDQIASSAEEAPAEAENAPAPAAEPPVLSPSSAPPPPEPAPAPRSSSRPAEESEALTKESADGAASDSSEPTEDTYRNSGVGGPPTGGGDFDGNPDTGEGNPPTGSGTADANPDVGWGEEPEIPPLQLAIEAEMELLAQANAPAGCSFTIPFYEWSSDEGEVTFLARYRDAGGEEAGTLRFTCLIREEEKDGRPLWLEVLSCESWD